jgi:hypothetical protein
MRYLIVIPLPQLARVKYESTHTHFIRLFLAQVSLASERDVVAARLVKGRLERTTLGQVAADICIAFKPGDAAGCRFDSRRQLTTLPIKCSQSAVAKKHVKNSRSMQRVPWLRERTSGCVTCTQLACTDCVAASFT